MSTSTKPSVVRMIQNASQNPMEYHELVETWNALCEQAWSDPQSTTGFAEIENVAISVLSNVGSHVSSGQLGHKIGRLLNSFSHATYIVTTAGRVAAFNDIAFEKYDLVTGDSIDKLPFTLENARLISTVVREILSIGGEKSDAVLLRTFGKGNHQELTIAISPSIGEASHILIFVINSKWQTHSLALLKEQFNLTDTESEVLSKFISGYTSQEIAQQRGRSHATVRTQFQSLLTKTGSRSQTELLRIALSTSDFVEDLNSISDAFSHPHRRRAEIMLNPVRIVELTLMGDTSGTSILHLSNAVNCLIRRGLLSLS